MIAARMTFTRSNNSLFFGYWACIYVAIKLGFQNNIPLILILKAINSILAYSNTQFKTESNGTHKTSRSSSLEDAFNSDDTWFKTDVKEPIIFAPNDLR